MSSINLSILGLAPKSMEKKWKYRCLHKKTSKLLHDYRQQPSPLLYSIDIWAARNSRLTQRETNHYISRCASELAWPYLAGSSPGQLVIDLFAQHQRFAVCCQLAFSTVYNIPFYHPAFHLMRKTLKKANSLMESKKSVLMLYLLI